MRTKRNNRNKPTNRIERYFTNLGFKFIAGVDEVGMSALAGPVAAAAVILKQYHVKGLYDSKSLNPGEREEIFSRLVKAGVIYSVGFSSVSVIAEKGIYKASREAMLKAISGLPNCPDFLLIDGRAGLQIDLPQQAIEKGDEQSVSIAAASIIAKVVRDSLMEQLHDEYPDYGWISNKGYSSSFHKEALREYGSTPYHRVGFKGVGNYNDY